MALRLGSVVICADDVASTVEFHERTTGLAPSCCERELGFALVGTEQTLAIAFWAGDVAAAFETAVRAGAVGPSA